MTGSARQRYTDRDVRENEMEMRHLVEEFLESYHGDFEFLIDCKMRQAQGLLLTVGMVRGVLNCMRHDPRVRNLPNPMEPVFDEEDPEYAQVIQLRPKKKCISTEPHNAHQIKGYEWCNGVRWPVTRRYQVEVDARVRGKYIIAKSIGVIHLVHKTGDHITTWNLADKSREGLHQDGEREFHELIVRTQCKMRIHNGFLFNNKDKLGKWAREKFDKSPRGYCKGCFPE